jgi:hypothetical protein
MAWYNFQALAPWAGRSKRVLFRRAAAFFLSGIFHSYRFFPPSFPSCATTLLYYYYAAKTSRFAMPACNNGLALGLR